MDLPRVNLARMNLHIELAGTYGSGRAARRATHRNVPPHDHTAVQEGRSRTRRRAEADADRTEIVSIRPAEASA